MIPRLGDGKVHWVYFTKVALTCSLENDSPSRGRKRMILIMQIDKGFQV